MQISDQASVRRGPGSSGGSWDTRRKCRFDIVAPVLRITSAGRSKRCGADSNLQLISTAVRCKLRFKQKREFRTEGSDACRAPPIREEG